MMKGADPVYQIDLRSDPPCSMAPLPGDVALLTGK